MKKAFALVLLAWFCSAAAAEEKVAWLRSYREAQVKAKSTSLPIFIDLYADWCTWCLKLDQEVYSRPEFVSFMQGFVPLKVDTQDNKEGTQTAEAFNVVGLPTLLVADARGNILNRIVGFVTAKELVQDLKSIQSLLEQEKANPSRTETSLELSRLYIEKEMYSQAQPRLQKILSSPSVTEGQREKTTYWLANAYYYENRVDAAQQVLEEYHAEFPKGAFRESALLLLSQVYIEKNFEERAISYLKELIQEFPKSDSAVRARQVLQALE